MTTEKQVLANRRNAQKSTGAKTPEGKASVRFNAMKHGLLAQDVLLPGEDETALKELGKLLRDELQPVGGMENLLVDRIVDAYWRLRRLGRVEAGMFTWEQYEELAERAANEARSYLQMIYKTEEERRLKTPHVMDEQKYDEAYDRAQEMKAKQEEETAMLGGAFIRDADKANAFSKLSRYETSIERSLYKALHELQRLQAARHAEGNVPPPVAVDVDVSGVSREDLLQE